ncbi:acyl-CoA dehydrogenase family protein [Acrocarpospora catenulata]|uniref:acyl-CoA dehydrogenase family protein n=1 Tax=Acrocarpospora catenulata TaxID=2836182 RepID=UPI001BDA9EE2|nr:acyl-CoA dehydrogenase family protein [Acrocarpospora catenulata]
MVRTEYPFTDDQLALATAVRGVLAKHCPPGAVRAVGTDRSGERLPGWRQLAAAGLFGVRREGRRLADTILAFEETGRAALPGPVVETAVIAPGLLPADQLDELARGGLRVSARLGDQVHVPDADLAELLIVGHRGAVHAVPRDSVRLTPQPGVDPVRRLFTVTDPPPGTEIATRAQSVPALRAATVAVAAQLVGLARHLLETSVTRARTGPSYADLKPRLADVALAIDYAATHVYAAAAALGSGGSEPGPVVSAAKATAGQAAADATRIALHIHGSIARNSDLYPWLARVWSLASAYGATDLHRTRLTTANSGSGRWLLDHRPESPGSCPGW